MVGLPWVSIWTASPVWKPSGAGEADGVGGGIHLLLRVEGLAEPERPLRGDGDGVGQRAGLRPGLFPVPAARVSVVSETDWTV